MHFIIIQRMGCRLAAVDGAGCTHW